MTDFVTVAQASELSPGERMIVQVGRTWVAVFNVDGQFYAIQDICTHDGGPLAEGKLFGCEIECPRHGARFDLRDGRVTAPPALVPVPVYDVRLQDGQIQVASKKR
jgi:3-phenylpropionate/trans-cinnamate dioxygenase ferredoxin subunit